MQLAIDAGLRRAEQGVKMQVEQSSWIRQGAWDRQPGRAGMEAQLVLAFGGSSAFANRAAWEELTRAYPDARVAGCTTAREIAGTSVTDDSFVATASRFEHTRVLCASVRVADAAQSRAAGNSLAFAIPHNGLSHVFVHSEGLRI